MQAHDSKPPQWWSLFATAAAAAAMRRRLQHRQHHHRHQQQHHRRPRVASSLASKAAAKFGASKQPAPPKMTIKADRSTNTNTNNNNINIKPTVIQQQQQQPKQFKSFTLSFFFQIQTILIVIQTILAVAPTIDYSHNMRVLKLPASTKPGTLIYRLRGSDGDQSSQLSFGVMGIEARGLLDVVPVSRSWNEADVYLRTALVKTAYNLSVFVSDGGQTTQIESTIYVTQDEDASTSKTTVRRSSPFVESPTQSGHGCVFNVPESAQPGDSIGSITALESESSNLPVRFELRGAGADAFAFRYVFGPAVGQTRAELVLAKQLDYEHQNVYLLHVLALNAWTNKALDTRNVATLDIVVVVGDVQDVGPVFRQLPAFVRLASDLRVHQVLLRVSAEDGDVGGGGSGARRPISYALDSSSPLAAFLTIDKTTGDVQLARPMSELRAAANWHSAEWQTLTVIAAESVAASGASSASGASGGLHPQSSADSLAQGVNFEHHLWPMVARADVHMFPVDVRNEAPEFKFNGVALTNVSKLFTASDASDATQTLHGVIDERAAAAGGQIVWRSSSSTTTNSHSSHLHRHSKVYNDDDELIVEDNGAGANGTFELRLEGADAALFRLEPTGRVERRAQLHLFARGSRFDFDYDATNAQRRFELELVATDFGGDNDATNSMSTRLRLSVDLLDVNDNAPSFSRRSYTASVYENAPLGELVTIIAASDADSDARVRFTRLSGVGSNQFRLDQTSGRVTVNEPLDREARATYELLVEARDDDGAGQNANVSTLTISVLDVNDNAPVFTQTHYEAVLSADGGSFEAPLVVRALDNDEAGGANAQVAYEIVAGNQNDAFAIDALTGVVYLANSNRALFEFDDGGGAAGANLQPGGSSNTQTRPVPSEMPSVLLEPLRPYNTTQNNKDREVEETTAGARFGTGRLNTANDTANQHNQTTKPQPTTTTAPTPSPKPTTSQLDLKEFEQLPATLDLLLNLESSPPTLTSVSPNDDNKDEPLEGARKQLRRAILTTSSSSSSSLSPPSSSFSNQLLPPLTTLVVRAHDFGIPVRSATAKVSIHNLALASRSLSVILNGTAEQLEPRRRDIERALASLAGARTTIESIDTLSDTSSLSVARVRMALPLHTLVDLTDPSTLLAALDLNPVRERGTVAQQPPPYDGNHHFYHSASSSNISAPSSSSSSFSSSSSSSNTQNNANNDNAGSYPLEPHFALERRLLVYIIIVGVCILALLTVWLIYACSREDRVKIVEKHLPAPHPSFVSASTGMNSAAGLASVSGALQPAALSSTAADSVTATAPKTAAGSDVIDRYASSAIGANIAKTLQLQARQQQLGADASSSLPTARQHIAAKQLQQQPNYVATRPAHITQPIAVIANDKPANDRLPTCNGQIWFEPAPASSSSGVSRAPRSGLSTRRASSAPSASESQLAAQRLPAGTLSTRDASGMFFPNSVAYMQNLAALPTSTTSAQGLIGRRGLRTELVELRQRRRRVAPAPFNKPGEPPRHARGGHSNLAFVANDDDDDDDAAATAATFSSRGSEGSGSEESGSGDSLLLASDQELLGFDTTGTPIIATRARHPLDSKPLLVKLGTPTTGASTEPLPTPSIGSMQQQQQQAAFIPKRQRQDDERLRESLQNTISQQNQAKLQTNDITDQKYKKSKEKQQEKPEIGAKGKHASSLFETQADADKKVKHGLSQTTAQAAPSSAIVTHSDKPVTTAAAAAAVAGAIVATGLPEAFADAAKDDDEEESKSEINIVDKNNENNKPLLAELNPELERRRDSAEKPSLDQLSSQLATGVSVAGSDSVAAGEAASHFDNNNNKQQQQGRPRVERLESVASSEASSANLSLTTQPTTTLLTGDLMSNVRNKELLDKKSVFAIAYSGVATSKLPN